MLAPMRETLQQGILLLSLFSLTFVARIALQDQIRLDRESLVRKNMKLGIKQRLNQWSQFKYEIPEQNLLTRWAELHVKDSTLSLTATQVEKLRKTLPRVFAYLAAPSPRSFLEAFPTLTQHAKLPVQKGSSDATASVRVNAPSGLTPLASIVNQQSFEVWFEQQKRPCLVALAPNTLQLSRSGKRTVDGGVVSLAHRICTLAAHAASSDLAVSAMQRHKADDVLVIVSFLGKVDSSSTCGPFIASLSWDASEAAWLPRKMCFDAQLHFQVLF